MILQTLELKESSQSLMSAAQKQKVVHFAEKALPEQYQFIGGHPMAGSHKSGVIAAKDFLFENAFYILTPAKETKRQAVERLMDLLKGDTCSFHRNDTRRT
ncbi:hypothetical protein BsIDN1_39310 [Bacillus safensis]|uniref:Prephenate/arogenate dehydrogenase domain-containing protein n=1 Tax=Bacillus safensis TaxID=561879 RepID=A0A5S9MB17_BACIA|nr:hypothetical protein BsIDN1_39310 [Bacillus safensis]